MPCYLPKTLLIINGWNCDKEIIEAYVLLQSLCGLSEEDITSAIIEALLYGHAGMKCGNYKITFTRSGETNVTMVVEKSLDIPKDELI